MLLGRCVWTIFGINQLIRLQAKEANVYPFTSKIKFWWIDKMYTQPEKKIEVRIRISETFILDALLMFFFLLIRYYYSVVTALDSFDDVVKMKMVFRVFSWVSICICSSFCYKSWFNNVKVPISFLESICWHKSNPYKPQSWK